MSIVTSPFKDTRAHMIHTYTQQPSCPGQEDPSTAHQNVEYSRSIDPLTASPRAPTVARGARTWLVGRPDSGVPDAVRRHIRIRGPPTGVRGMTRTCIHGSVCVLCILWPPPELPRKGVYWLFTDNFYNSERGVRCKAGSLSQLVSMPVPSVPNCQKLIHPVVL